MKHGFYTKLALMGIYKNRRLYLPYLFACVVMTAMYYIVDALSVSPTLLTMRGAPFINSMLNFGRYVIILFVTMFLFYSHSFLIRRRKKEFGLYNVLGMGKWNLIRILFLETVFLLAATLILGNLAGILLSKLAEAGLINLVREEINFTITVSTLSLLRCAQCFSVIFFLVFLHALWQIRASSARELMSSENAGEKPPKANWLLAIAGLVLLAAAYFLAVTITDPVAALVYFFVAVVMVILATYLLFIAGSVTFCRLLQKNKRYYYRTNHFISVSSLVYRMKRSGASLASLCILSTMVLVAVSATYCLYEGTEETILNECHGDISLTTSISDAKTLNAGTSQEIRGLVQKTAAENGLRIQNAADYHTADYYGFIAGERFYPHKEVTSELTAGHPEGRDWYMVFFPLDEYNRMTGHQETLAPGEAMIFTFGGDYTAPTLTLTPDKVLHIKKEAPDFEKIPLGLWTNLTASVCFVVPDFSDTLLAMSTVKAFGQNGEWNYYFDLPGSREEVRRTGDALEQALTHWREEKGETAPSIRYTTKDETASEYYSLNGSFFFLGILLGLVFCLATVLIMYYKQLTEGYEDQNRFIIMRRIGLTRRDIRRSVNSQMLTVFFLPLLAAGLHLGFAFPFVRLLLLLFGLTNTHKLAMSTLGCYAVFALMYVLTYRITSRTYYTIVSSQENTAY